MTFSRSIKKLTEITNFLALSSVREWHRRVVYEGFDSVSSIPCQQGFEHAISWPETPTVPRLAKKMIVIDLEIVQKALKLLLHYN